MILALIALFASAFAAGRLPLLEVPGFELGLLSALGFALAFGPFIGLEVVRCELAGRAAGARSAIRPFLAGSVAATALLAVLFVAPALRSALLSPCRPLGGALVFVLVAWPSALLAVALGVLAALWSGGRRLRMALSYTVIVTVLLTVTLLQAYFGPAASVYDHLFGVWPGPLYDDAIPVDGRWMMFRVGTLAWVGFVVAVAEHWVRRRSGCRGRGVIGCWAGVFLLIAVGARLAGGGMVTRRELTRVLGGTREGPRCVLHFPREKSAEMAERMWRDCEYDAEEVARALGLAHPPRVTVWVYRDPEEKRRWVGAEDTSYTKPWLFEIHLNDEGVPHPVLRHELVHALAAAVVSGPLRVPARAGFAVNVGLIEGLAVALEVPSGSFGVHAWARAMRDEGNLPPVVDLVGGESAEFFTIAPSRAYVASGSFLRFLLDRYGTRAVLNAYASDDVRAVGRALPELEAEWQEFLDGVSVPPALVSAAAARFRSEGLLERTCGREVAALDRQAREAVAAGQVALAEVRFRRASALSGGDPAPLRSAAEAWRQRGDDRRAEGILVEALHATEAEGTRLSRVQILNSLGDLRLKRGDGAGAAARYRTALSLGVDGGMSRVLRAKLIAAEDPELGAAIAGWLLGQGDAALDLSRVAQSRAPLARYLLGRARLQRGAPAEAARDFASLDPASLPAPEFARELRKLTAEALCRSGRWTEGIAAWVALANGVGNEGERAQAADAARRCRFERDTYGAKPSK